jgi:hypothetical protein
MKPVGNKAKGKKYPNSYNGEAEVEPLVPGQTKRPRVTQLYLPQTLVPENCNRVAENAKLLINGEE